MWCLPLIRRRTIIVMLLHYACNLRRVRQRCRRVRYLTTHYSTVMIKISVIIQLFEFLVIRNLLIHRRLCHCVCHYGNSFNFGTNKKITISIITMYGILKYKLFKMMSTVTYLTDFSLNNLQLPALNEMIRQFDISPQTFKPYISFTRKSWQSKFDTLTYNCHK